ncbi:hypothetical protein C8Q78DRAFT_1009110 [Trametes maxima]|nr:hypothetical protein C8Q78DRAFT_1009110 [Trametes maxima]
MKSVDTRKASKRKQPYERSKGSNGKFRTTRVVAATKNISASSRSKPIAPLSESEPPAPPAFPNSLVPAREVYLEIFNKAYPTLLPRDDYDIMMLGANRRTGTKEEILAWVDRCMEADIEESGSREAVLESAKQLLDDLVAPTGRKPRPGRDTSHIRPIPNSKYSIRLWPGNPYVNEYCMDIVDTATKQPVNSPFEFDFWIIPDLDTPWLGGPAGCLRSLERNFGIPQHKILPGEEKWVLRDGQSCLIRRPGEKDIRFTVPVRKRRKPPITEEVYILDFPKEDEV